MLQCYYKTNTSKNSTDKIAAYCLISVYEELDRENTISKTNTTPPNTEYERRTLADFLIILNVSNKHKTHQPTFAELQINLHFEVNCMKKINVIHIVGASGAGTTTLAQALEQKHGYKWLDTDNFFWLPTNPPFTNSRPREERISLMSASIAENPKCAISGSLCDWGDVFIPKFDLVIFIYTPANIRKNRLQKREYKRFGERINKCGDMYDEHKKFIEWAVNYDILKPPERCKILHEEWLGNLNCPILRLDGTKTVEELIKLIEDFISLC
ncbi:MAG: hypothetical protein FWH20_09415 [Oscillospiraceae bacterium]|nr:hypothetical protein [Oscillospiraceae bacterium]